LVQLLHASHQPSSSSSNLGESISRAYDEDLLRAIALSLAISESEESGISSSVEIDNEVITPTLTPVDAIKVRALHDFSASGPEELSFNAGDIIHVLGAVYKQWYKGSLRDQTGIFPITHVEVIEETPREVESDVSEPPLSPENDDECKICFDGVPDHCLVPCGHAGMCETCSKAMRACPFCKKEVGQALKLWKI
jgi:SH3 domain/Zinc finger, C3HC4 type (RING finger)